MNETLRQKNSKLFFL